jgi:hypothetical protein
MNVIVIKFANITSWCTVRCFLRPIIVFKDHTKNRTIPVQVAHTCNPNCWGVWDQEDSGLRTVGSNSSWDPIPKIGRLKWARGLTQVAEHLLCKHEALNSNPNPHPPHTHKRWMHIKRGSKSRFFFKLNSTKFLWVSAIAYLIFHVFEKIFISIN